MAGMQTIRTRPLPRPRKKRQPLYKDWRIWIGAALGLFMSVMVFDAVMVSRNGNGRIEEGPPKAFAEYKAKAALVPYPTLLSGYALVKGQTAYYTVRVYQVFNLGREQQLHVVVSPSPDSYVEKEGELDQMILSCGNGSKCADLIAGPPP
ncbi:MAG: hypothetical protein FJ039_12640 [Chloroflexi bacterium]|nr:hypothetical protein [Chloroflexota bacterium]